MLVTDIKRCRNCGNEFSGKYCSQCSQKHFEREHLSISHFFKEAFHQFTHFDGKIFSSIKLLLSKPGFLSDEYVQGRHKKYISPVSFFIILNLFFYLLGYKLIGIFHWSFAEMERNIPGAGAAIQNKLAAGISLSELSARFNIARSPYIKMVFLFIIPAFALCMNLLFIKKKRTFIEHLIFSVHFYAFNLFFLSLGLLLIGLIVELFSGLFGIDNPMFLADPYLSIWITILMAIYLFFAVKKFYKLNSGWTAISILPILFLYLGCTFILGKIIIFYLTIWSI